VGSSWRYLGTAVGFGFGVVWMTVGVGSAILVLLCASLGYGIALVAERERAGLSKLRTTNQTAPAKDTAMTPDERARDKVEAAPLSAEVEYGWPSPSTSGA
jgi:uncharacterized membrane protein